MILRFNILCVAAAVAGLIGILLPWVTTTAYMPTTDESHLFVDDYIAATAQLPREEGLLIWIVLGAFTVVAGTALTFTTPLGGIVQSAGLSMTLIGGYLGDDPYFFDYPEMATKEPGIGIYVTAIGATMAVMSIFVPVFLGTKKPVGAGPRDERFVAWTIGRGK